MEPKEIIDVLKDNKYIVSTDDSQGIADKCNITHGGGGDDFPYEYACPDNFSVTVQPSDWEYHQHEYTCTVSFDQIPLNIPNDYLIRYYKCNGSQYGWDEGCAWPAIWGGEYDIVRASLVIDDENMAIDSVELAFPDGDSHPDPLIPATLNFTDLLFVSNVKK